MSKTYQNSKIDTPDALELTVPEHVSVVMAEVAVEMREGLLALWPASWTRPSRPPRPACARAWRRP